MKLFATCILWATCLFAKGQFLDEEPKYAVYDRSRVQLQTSLPKGGLEYTDPGGNNYAYVIFWTQVKNQSAAPVEFTVNFPADSFPLPASPDTYFQLVLPRADMTPDRETLFNYGLAQVDSVLDIHFQKPSGLQSILAPNEARAFYVVALFNQRVQGVVRAAMVFKEDELRYRINGKEIPCGQIEFLK